MKIGLSLLAAALASLPTAASAASYLFTFTGAISGSGQLTTSDTLNAVGGFDITGVSGTFNGFTITGLVANPNQPFASSTGSYTYDNVLFPGQALKFDRYGIGFTTTGASYNIFDSAADGTSPPPGLPYGLLDSVGTGIRFGNFTLTAVPEPASWAMMIAGFGVVGFAMRRRGQTVRVSFA